MDFPSFHTLASRPDDKMTLTQDASVVTQETGDYAKTVGIFEFTTREAITEFEIGSAVDLVHSRYGFSAGARGIVVKTSKNWRARKVTAQIAVRLTGLWPTVPDTSYPYVAVGDFE